MSPGSRKPPPPRNVIPFIRKAPPPALMPEDLGPDNSLRERAWCVATFDAASGQLLRASVYSASASGLTRSLNDETLLDGPVGLGRTYEEARRAVVKQLKEMPCYRWLWRAVRDYDAKTGLSRV